MPEAQIQPNQDPKPEPKPITLREAVDQWNGLKAHLHSMERKVLELTRHKDAEPEQLLQAHEIYKRTHATLVEMQAKLQAKFPVERLPGMRLEVPDELA